MRRVITGDERPLVPIADALDDPTREFDFIPLEDRDFLARDGQLVLSCAIFNPFGPTWITIGFMPTEDDRRLVFYRMLNPFGQTSAAIGTLSSSQLANPDNLGLIIEGAFARETLYGPNGEEIRIVGGGPPDIIEVMHADARFVDDARRSFVNSPVIRDADISSTLQLMREFVGRPWDMASERLRRGLADSGAPERNAHSADQARDGNIDEWFAYAMSNEYSLPILIALPSAWHGSIDNAGEPLARGAYTFWQLDDFLSRYGYPVFRKIADAMRE